MIPRYTLPRMGALWSEENKFQKWLEVEIAVCEVQAEMGTIPREALNEIKAKASFTVEQAIKMGAPLFQATTEVIISDAKEPTAWIEL